jgi:hypothetical protein
MLVLSFISFFVLAGALLRGIKQYRNAYQKFKAAAALAPNVDTYRRNMCPACASSRSFWLQATKRATQQSLLCSTKGSKMRQARFLVVGDSHTEVFGWINKVTNSSTFEVCMVAGATAAGLTSPNSKSQARNILLDKISEPLSQRHDYLVVMVGEIDCGCVVWFRVQQHGTTVEHELGRSIASVSAFLHEAQQRFNKPADRIILASVVLPTIRDTINPPPPGWAVANQRWTSNCGKESLRARTRVTFEFNRLLEQLARERGHVFVDVTRSIVSETTGLLDDR